MFSTKKKAPTNKQKCVSMKRSYYKIKLAKINGPVFLPIKQIRAII